MFCMGHKMKLAKCVLCVLFWVLKGKIICFTGGRNEFQKRPGHIGSLALWKEGGKTNQTQSMYM